MFRYKNVSEETIVFPTIATVNGSLVLGPGDVVEVDIVLTHPGLVSNKGKQVAGQGVGVVDEVVSVVLPVVDSVDAAEE